MLAARKVPAALKWIEDRRENLMSAGQARHVDGNARMAFDDDGNDPGRRHRLRPGRRRLPDAVPGADHRRHRHVLPRPLPGAQGQLQLQDGVLQHRRPARLPRSLAVRNAGAGDPARHRGPQDGHRSGRAAPPQHPARRRDAVLQPQRHAVRPCRPGRHRSSRPSRSSTTKASARSRPRRWRRAATSGSGFSAYIEPTGAATGHLATEGAHHPHGADRQDQRLRQRRLERQQHRDHRRSADRRRARRRHRRRRPPSRATPR